MPPASCRVRVHVGSDNSFYELCEFSVAAEAKCHKLGGGGEGFCSNNRNLVSHSARGQKSTIKVLAGPGFL